MGTSNKGKKSKTVTKRVDKTPATEVRERGYRLPNERSVTTYTLFHPATRRTWHFTPLVKEVLLRELRFDKFTGEMILVRQLALTKAEAKDYWTYLRTVEKVVKLKA